MARRKAHSKAQYDRPNEIHRDGRVSLPRAAERAAALLTRVLDEGWFGPKLSAEVATVRDDLNNALKAGEDTI